MCGPATKTVHGARTHRAAPAMLAATTAPDRAHALPHDRARTMATAMPVMVQPEVASLLPGKPAPAMAPAAAMAGSVPRCWENKAYYFGFSTRLIDLCLYPPGLPSLRRPGPFRFRLAPARSLPWPRA